ncbi:hypothetical protein FA95DRAFT_696549 [Auriscalpium vulgare]|uniref:Uncharacterized protein n=1 Tax=Auriscalpium vulgare TaxID=40419 RepID=A0ACB8RB64_9AGAM|nr:hypothetical protein FA95DRAFT_696549 [Auriscalpium vulgare]
MDVLIIAFYPLLIETLLFGLFTGLITLSTYFLIWRAHTRASATMLALTVVLYISAAVHWVLSVTAAACVLRGACELTILVTPHGTTRQIITGMMLNINFMLSDVIVLWRAWVLWGRARAVGLISGVLFTGTVGAAVTSATVGQGVPVSSAPISQAAVAVACLSLASNVWATALVAYTAWEHRMAIGERLSDSDRRTRVEITLGLLVESGCLYCVFWILVILSSKAALGALGPVIAACIVQVAGIYPTLIVAAVALQRTPAHGASTYADPGVSFTTHLSGVPPPDQEDSYELRGLSRAGAEEASLQTPSVASKAPSERPA